MTNTTCLTCNRPYSEHTFENYCWEYTGMARADHITGGGKKVSEANIQDEVNLCKSCNTAKHLNADGLCGRCAKEWAQTGKVADSPPLEAKRLPKKPPSESKTQPNVTTQGPQTLPESPETGIATGTDKGGPETDTTPDSFKREVRSIISLYEIQVAEDLTAMEDENYRPKYSLNEPVAAILAAHEREVNAALVRELQALASSNNWRVQLEDRLAALQEGADD